MAKPDLKIYPRTSKDFITDLAPLWMTGRPQQWRLGWSGEDENWSQFGHSAAVNRENLRKVIDYTRLSLTPYRDSGRPGGCSGSTGRQSRRWIRVCGSLALSQLFADFRRVRGRVTPNSHIAGESRGSASSNWAVELAACFTEGHFAKGDACYARKLLKLIAKLKIKFRHH
jgi:hypothetical protein